MAEKCECSMKTEFNHLKDDIIEIKNTVKEDAKETTKEMMGMRDSKIRTEIALEAIIKTQEATILSQNKMMGVVQEIKDTPYNAWKQMSVQLKVGVMLLIASYVFGTLKSFGLFR